MPKKRRPPQMQKRTTASQEEIMHHMMSGSIRRTPITDAEMKLWSQWMDAMFAAYKVGNTAEFEVYKGKLEAAGCTVRYENNEPVSVLFPSEASSGFFDDMDDLDD